MDMARIDDLQEEKKKKGAKGVTARWQRRMKLTPCGDDMLYAAWQYADK